MLIPTVPALMRRATRCPRAGSTVWTGDPARGHRVARRIKAGTVGINMPYTAFPGIPFGGYKQSGFGRELGIDALDLYLETKSVIINTGTRRATRRQDSPSTTHRPPRPRGPRRGAEPRRLARLKVTQPAQMRFTRVTV